jgi:hypothetical protein
VSLKEVLPPFLVLSSTSVSGTTVYVSSISAVLYKDTIVYQSNISGSPQGTMEALVSLDYNPGTPQSGGTSILGNWASIGSVSIVSTTTSPVVLQYQQVGAPWIKFQFTSTTASGVIDVRVSGKSLG